jgi:hypothetical protein
VQTVRHAILLVLLFVSCKFRLQNSATSPAHGLLTTDQITSPLRSLPDAISQSRRTTSKVCSPLLDLRCSYSSVDRLPYYKPKGPFSRFRNSFDQLDLHLPCLDLAANGETDQSQTLPPRNIEGVFHNHRARGGTSRLFGSGILLCCVTNEGFGPRVALTSRELLSCATRVFSTLWTSKPFGPQSWR